MSLASTRHFRQMRRLHNVRRTLLEWVRVNCEDDNQAEADTRWQGALKISVCSNKKLPGQKQNSVKLSIFRSPRHNCDAVPSSATTQCCHCYQALCILALYTYTTPIWLFFYADTVISLYFHSCTLVTYCLGQSLNTAASARTSRTSVCNVHLITLQTSGGLRPVEPIMPLCNWELFAEYSRMVSSSVRAWQRNDAAFTKSSRDHLCESGLNRLYGCGPPVPACHNHQ